MSERPLDLMRLKLNRANTRLKTLHRELDRWGKAHPIQVVTELDRDSGWHTSYIREWEPLPARFAIPIGESLYHGRSVLDHLVWALVKANKQTPGEHNEFPILAKPPPSTRKGEHKRDAFIRNYRNGKLRGVHPDAIALIEGLQPYKRRKRPPYVLTLLNDMAREDRHRTLHVARATMADPRTLPDLGIHPPKGVVILESEALFESGDRLVPGTKLGRFRLSRYGRKPKVGMEADLPVLITVGKQNLAFGALYEINANLAKLLSLFDGFL